MANKINVVLGMDTSAFARSIAQIERKTAQLGKSFASVGQTMSLSITAPFAILATKAAQAFDVQAKAIAQVEAGLKSTGATAGFTSQELQKMASALQGTSLFGDEEILKDVTAQLLTFTNIAGEQFSRTQKAALDLATRLDGDLKGASIQLGKALNDPVKGLAALGRSGIQFSAEQKEVINTLAQTNRLAEAQTMILDELEKQYGGSAEAAARAGLGPLKQMEMAFGDLLEVIGKVVVEAIVPFADRLKGLFERLQSINPVFLRVALAVGAVLAAIGPLLFIIGKAITLLPVMLTAVKGLGAAFTLLTGPVGLTVVAIAALVAGLVIAYKRSAEFRELVARIGMAIKQGFAQAVEIARAELARLRAGFEAMRPQLQKAWEILVILIKAWVGLQKILVTIYANVLGAFLSVWIGVFSALRESASQFFDEFKANIKAFGTAFEELKKGNFKAAIQGLGRELANDGANMAEAFTTGFKRGFDGTRDFFAGVKKAFNADIPAAAAQGGEASGAAIAGGGIPGTPGAGGGGTAAAEQKKSLADSIAGFAKLRQEIVETQAASASLGMAIIAPLREFDDGTKAAQAALQAFGTAFDLATTSANVFGLSALETVKSQLSVVASELQKGIEVFGVNSIVVDTLRQKYAELSEQLLILQQQEAASIEMQQAIGSAIQQAGNIIAGAFTEGTITMKKFGKAVLQASGQVIGAFIREGVAGIVKNILAGPTGALGPVAIGIAAAAGAAASGLFTGLLNSISTPKFARGGMVTGQTLAVVGDNPSGKEAIIPFERMGEFLDMAGGGQTRLTGLFEVRGSDLILVLDRAQQEQARVR